MSCCAEKTGLSRLAEDPRIICFAYFCALLPLAAIYALDFITRDWKSTMDTHRAGKLHLVVSLPPLAGVVFYIHLQKFSEDYKEMATASTAAVLCILHVLRTLWGLLQLRAFKEWNIHALQVLTRMGFKIPISPPSNEPDNSSQSDVPRRNGMSTASFKKSLASIHGTLLESLVDKYMMVNSSLVDNEFIGADLPCCLNFSLLSNIFQKTGLSAPNFLTCRKPEECTVRWLVSFLARFGSDWLIHTEKFAHIKTIPRTCGWDILENGDLSSRLAVSMAYVVTHAVESKGEDGSTSVEPVSILSPLHMLCSNVLETWDSSLIVTKKAYLPYQTQEESKFKELDFSLYCKSIQNALSAWDKHSFNELSDDGKHAVMNMNVQQVACFSKLMQERDSYYLSISQLCGSERGAKIFVWQLGYLSDPFKMNSVSFEEAWSEFFGAFPVLESSLGLLLSGDSVEKPSSGSFEVPSSEFPSAFSYLRPGSDDSMVQASLHIDNWFALETGHFSLAYNVAQKEVVEREADTQHWGQTFSAQKYIELRRLQLAVAKGEGRHVHALSKIKFLGCVMDKARRSLVKYYEAHDDWSPSIVLEAFPVVCSHQLSDALQEVAAKTNSEAEKIQQRSLQMRILWAIQMSLTPENADTGDPTSSSLMMLCMLGYPSLFMSQVNSCPNLRVIPRERESNGGNVFVPVCADDEADTTGSVHTEVDSVSTRNCLDEKYVCLRIEIAEAPQPLHIIFQWNSETKHATVQIVCNAGHAVPRFCWQVWRNGFMGRICAQSEWRSSRLHHTNEMLHILDIGASLPKGNESIAEVSKFGTSVPCWPVWVPFGGWKVNSSEDESDISATTSEVECQCGCKAHTMFLEAKEQLGKGHEKEALELFNTCIVDHRHFHSVHSEARFARISA